MSTTNDMFWEIVKSDFSWLMKEKGDDDDDWGFYDEKDKNSAKVLLCDSFYDLFISPFSTISLSKYRPKFNSYIDSKTLSINEDFLSFYKFLMRNDKQINNSTQTILTTSRGDAFFIPDSRISDNDDLITNGLNFEFHNFGAYNKWKYIIKYIFIKYETRKYGLLTLKNTSEENFKPNKHFFSFAINYFKNHFHEGDIYFFSSDGLNYAKKNVVQIINSYLLENTKSTKPKDFYFDTSFDILEYSHQFNKYEIRTEITFFKETDFIYTVDLSETLGAGRLREEWIRVKARINFLNDEILDFSGSKSIESLK
jgi:hypothetical protein